MRLYEQGIEESSVVQIIFGNIMMLVWIAVGAISCWFIHPVIALVYISFALVMVFIVLRKLVCTNCYYYGKKCHLGWGKLSVMLFSQGDIEKFGTCTGIKLAPLTYGLLTLIPLIHDSNSLSAVVLSMALRTVLPSGRTNVLRT